jgi:hypothetical protein
MSNVYQDRYAMERKPEGTVRPPLRIVEIRARRKCPDTKHVDENNVQHLVSVTGSRNNNIVEKGMTYKSPWNMFCLGRKYKRDGKV